MDLKQNDGWLLKDSSPERRKHIEQIVDEYRRQPSLSTYVSVPTSSGKRGYAVLEKYGVQSNGGLPPGVFQTQVVDLNVAEGHEFADRVSASIGKKVIAPIEFNVQQAGWTQEETMFLWYRIIEEKISEARFKDDWHYSNGASQEFLRVMEMQFGYIRSDRMAHFPSGADRQKEYLRMRNIFACDEAGFELRIDKGCLLIASAVLEVKQRGFMPKKLIDCVHKLTAIGNAPNLPIQYAYDLDEMERAREKISTSS